MIQSRSSTPLSQTSTLSESPSTTPELKSYHSLYKNPRIPASNIIELIASHSTSSSTVYIYDVAEQAGFGTLTKSWSESTNATASVVRLQTRAGAGLSLVGRLSEGTSRDTVKGAVLTAYTTPSGLGVMAQSLSYLPPASPTSRLVVQVPTVIHVGENFSLSPSLAPLATALDFLPETVVVLLSATPQESVDITSLSYKLTTSHVVHFFDHHSSSREIGHAIDPPLASKSTGLALSEAIRLAGYSFFDYFGDENAHTIIVLLNGPIAMMAKALASHVQGLGIVVVRVLRPWDETALLAAMPSTVKYVHVLDDVPNAGTQGILYVNVLASLLDWPVNGSSVYGHRIVPSETQQYLSVPSAFRHFLVTILPSPTPSSLDTSTFKKLIFFGTSKGPCSALPHVIGTTFLRNQEISTRLLTDHDVFSTADPVTANRILLTTTCDQNSHIPVPILFPLTPYARGESDFLGILDYTLLKTHSLLKYANSGSAVLVVTPWSVDDFIANVPADVLSLIVARNLQVCIINAKDISSSLVGASGPASDAMQNVIVHIAFLSLYLGNAATESIVYKVAKVAFGDVVQGIDLMKITARAWAGLLEVEIIDEGAANASGQSTLKEFDCNAIEVGGDGGDADRRARIGSWHDAARHLLFPFVFTPPYTFDSSKYPQNPALRPEITDRTFLVTCTVNRRLTPLEYDRNVFHLEFDSTGTGLEYAIGEALGVHGWNDESEVLDFCAWYDIDPARLITIPIVAGEGKMHTRTVLQALQQQIDLFGRPPKAFYTDLAAYATNPIDRYALQFIGSPEGASTFKKLAEKDTVTFADVLKMHESARPGIETLCEMVGDVKPRHYSIASAQSVVGNRVDLLVVTVDWVAPSGSLRYGQCTRYLASLKVGQKVTVSIKPSVMKLPPDDKQPIIMAGLGTGAAPFRAFLQHRASLVQQGKDIGPIYYYFGSRHQASEYLYGEEIEAYLLDGTITHAGLAFSRDGKKKVYIQHKMLEDADELVKMLKEENGVFYLCGPTWPVPDVYEALVGALVKFKGEDEATAGAYLEGLKEDERYVLEVY